MKEHQTLIVKFSTTCDPIERVCELKKRIGPDVLDSAPLFPDVDDEDLASVFEVQLRSECSAEETIKSLQTWGDVEYAHLPSDREIT